jgi:hypothetical protein
MRHRTRLPSGFGSGSGGRPTSAQIAEGFSPVTDFWPEVASDFLPMSTLQPQSQLEQQQY